MSKIPQIKRDSYDLLKAIITNTTFLNEKISADVRLKAINLIFQFPDDFIESLEQNSVPVEGESSIEEQIESQESWAAMERQERKEELERQLELMQAEMDALNAQQ